jgi:hypothetical protein
VLTAATGRLQLAWRVLRPQGTAYFDQLIDARTGTEISRRDRADHGLVHDTFPGAPVGGTAREMDLQPYLDAGATELSGPRAVVWADVDGNDKKEPGERISANGAGDFTVARKPPLMIASGAIAGTRPQWRR